VGKTVLLISPNPETSPSSVYPLALPRLAAYAEAVGHYATQFDVLVEGVDALPETLRRINASLVGLSIRNIDSTNFKDPRSYVGFYRQIMRIIHQYSSAPVVLGGSGFSLFPAEIMSLLGAEMGVVGPGEEALAALLSGNRDLASVPGLVTPEHPCPAPRPTAASLSVACQHDAAILSYYWKHSRMIGLQTKRGCPRSCSYCTYPLIEGSAMQWAAPTEIVEEIRKLLSVGVRYIFFTDSVYNIEAEREILLAEEICRQDVAVSWGAYFAPVGMTKEYLSILKRSGLTHLEFGTDSLNDAMLASYNKGFTVEDVTRTSKLCAELQLYQLHFLLFGGPGETVETVAESIRNARGLKQAVFFPFLGVRVYPGTPLHKAHWQGTLQAQESLLQPAFYFSPCIDRQTLWNLIADGNGFDGNWVLPSRHKEFERAMQRLRQRGTTGPLWECFEQLTGGQDHVAGSS